MDTINCTVALKIARAKVDELAQMAGDAFDIVTAETKEVQQGWLFFYNSADFIRTGEPMFALAGNGPLLVLRDGQVAMLPTAMPWQEAIGQFSNAAADVTLSHSA